jgi:hypothetical protein
MAQDPITRLQFACREIDRVLGDGTAKANPGLIEAVMLCATVDYATHRIANAIDHVATALLEPEENGAGAGIVRASELMSSMLRR